MLIDQNHREQFERYLQGQMRPDEAHAFERETLDDSFAQEALEGFEAQGTNSLEGLKKLRAQISTQKKSTFPFIRVAAAVALLIIGFYSVYFFTNQMESEQLAMEEKPVENLAQSSPYPDTVSIPIAQELEVANKRTMAEEDQSKTFKQDKIKVQEKDYELAQIAMADQIPEESVVEAISDDILAEISEDGEDNFSEVLQGRIAGAEEKVNDVMPNAIFLDTSKLDKVAITTRSLVAKKGALSYAISDADYEPAAIKKKSKTSPSAATLRSMPTNIAKISGTITDDTGEPLSGVNVVIKGTTKGVTTDLDGQYQLPITDNMTLVYSFVGFESQEIKTGRRSIIDVVLDSATELQEIVVTGYGTENTESTPSYSPARQKAGNRAYKKYLEDNLRYPEAVKQNEIEGIVILELTINSSGDISNIDIKKSLGYGCDQEAIRLVREGPKWNAAEKDGNKVEDKIRVRVRFKLDE